MRQCYEPRDIARPDLLIHEREIAEKSVGEKHPEGVGRALTLQAEVSEGPGGARLLPRAVDVSFLGYYTMEQDFIYLLLFLLCLLQFFIVVLENL
jgi:hypothetical protein